MTLLLVLVLIALFLWSSHHASRIDRLSHALAVSEHALARLTQRIWLLEQGGGAVRAAGTASPFRITGARVEPSLGVAELAPRPLREVPASEPPPSEPELVEPEVGTSPLAAPPPTSAPIEWEKWLGVRGAAATGAVILVVALLYFLRYSIESGFLTPPLRVWLGGLASALSVGCAHGWVRARHATLASWMTGAGVAGLYATLWSAVHVVGLLGPAVAFALSIGVTGLCIALALRLASLPVALLGILGGFAAPLALEVHAAAPLALLAYLLVLDLAAAALALARRWWSLVLYAMVATAAYHVAWTASLGPSASAQIAVVVLFAAVFGALPALAPSASRAEPQPAVAVLSTYASLLLSFAFAALLGLAAGTGAGAVVALIVALSLLGMVLAERLERPGMRVVAVLGALVASLAWLGSHQHAAGPLSYVALAFAGFAPAAAATALRPSRAGAIGVGASAASAALVLILGSTRSVAVALWVPSLLAIAAGAVIAARACDVPRLERASVTSLGVACALVSFGALAQRAGLGSLSVVWVGAACAFGAALLASRGERTAKQPSDALRAGAASGALVMLGAVALAAPRVGVGAAAAALGVFSALAWAAAGPSPHTYPLAAALAAAGLAAAQLGAAPAGSAAYVALLVVFGGALASAPVVSGRARPSTPPCQIVVLSAFGLSALALGTSQAHLSASAAVASTAALLLLVVAERTPARAAAGLTLGPFALTMGLAAAVVGLDGASRLVAIGALGLLAIALDRALSQRAVAVGGASLLALASALALEPRLLSGRPRGEVALLNGVTLTYLAPVALAWAAHLVTRRAAIRSLAGGLALAAGFVLANVCVLDLFAVGQVLSLRGASQARDLAMSMVWAVYAVALLALGLKRDKSALRWTSLSLCLLTAGKVFLFDLNNLRDLHRVAALVGLAASLLAISVSYQRFVMRRPAAAR